MSDDAVRSAVTQVVRAVFVSGRRVSWVEGVSNESLCSLPTVHGRKLCPNDGLIKFCCLLDIADLLKHSDPALNVHYLL